MLGRVHADRFRTHEVENQAPPFADVDLFAIDLPLREGLAREGAGWAAERVGAFGALCGRAETLALGARANQKTPELRSHDRYGNRIDEVEFDPAWHRIMALAMEHEVHNLPWREPRAGAYVARAALHSLLAQVESGSCCPLTMTFACVPALRHQPDVAAEWEPRVRGTRYEPRLLPLAQKEAVLVGMAMTEKQGGSDVRSNTTQAHAQGSGGPGQAYELVGHKWFCSAPMSDAFLTLAQTPRGLSCFLLPRIRPDGSRNAFRIQRLKDKLGNRSNASSEVEFAGSFARMLGEEGRGVRTIIDMVHHTRLDCVSGSAGLMRRALSEALHHTRYRAAFGKRLAEQPLMQSVQADLALESEAATALMLRLARAYDEAPRDEGSRAFARIATAVGKYWVCKRAPAMIVEAMECLGGNGYTEDWVLARLYREAPVNAIWEGSGNVICLDVLRAMTREPECVPALLAELRAARGGDARLDAAVAKLEGWLARPGDLEPAARKLVEQVAQALQASLLVRFAPKEVADAFCATRLGGDGGLGFGALAPGVDTAAIAQRTAW
ncbi:MAG TPA: isovaleryl-CoA dehydrogenase [Myxococcota bacterium]|nr:isovaleryl-CoA dehydrogenase [Myxococcota bacterium]